MRALLFGVLLSIISLSHAQDTIVTTLNGDVEGTIQKNIISWKGMRFAEPPTGEWRWRPTRQLTNWKGIQPAMQFGKDCIQATWGPSGMSVKKDASEDCLFINVWRTSKQPMSKKLPVMVWIHGGAFVFGSGSQAMYDGESFAEQGVVLVTFNYRLGRLGFFGFPALTAEHPNEFKGNYGYMDQIAALNWVKDNISAFGGDDNNITIFGESAGGVSVHSMLSIPAAHGLFDKAIIESGGGRDGVLTGRPLSKENADIYYPVSAETIGVNFAIRNGIIDIDANALAALRAMPAEQILDNGIETDPETGKPIYSGPILDGRLVIETAESAYKAGRQAKVPLLIGNNSAEVPAGFVSAESKPELLNVFAPHQEQVAKAFDPKGETDFAKLLTLINTDKVWAEPARFTARAFNQIEQPVYMYLFSYVAESQRERSPFGASHASELGYVFNTLTTVLKDKLTPKDQVMAEQIHSYWANFAKHGNPNGENLTIWPQYDDQALIMEFTAEGSSVARADDRNARLDAMEIADK